MTMVSSASGERNRDLTGAFLPIFLTSMAMMLFEIDLVRLFSILIRNISFFVLAISLFGIGLGGLYAQLWRARMRPGDYLEKRLFYLPLLFGASIILSLFVFSGISFSANAEATDLRTFIKLVVLFSVTSLPFFWGSMFISLLFAARAEHSSRLYFGDLCGASLGCLLAIPFLQWFGGLTLPFVVAALSSIPAALISAGEKRRLLVCAGVFCLAAGLGALNYAQPLVHLRSNSILPEGEALFSSWNFFSRITVEREREWRGWRLSDRYQGPSPEYCRIRQDGYAPAFIAKFDGNFSKVEHLRYDITSLPYRILDPGKVLIIGSGGGRDILTAKLYGVPEVHGVELNPITVNEVMRGAFREYSGNVYGLENVKIFVDNGRTYVQSASETYDLIYTSLADTLLGNSQGAFVLSENHLYTTEACEAYLNRLTPDGVGCFLYSALDDGHLLPRLVGAVDGALARLGIADTKPHFLAIMTPDPPDTRDEGVCLMFSKSPLPEAVITRARNACEDLGFTLAWPVAASAPAAENPWAQEIAAIVDPKTRGAYIAQSEFDITPLVDDRPYLFYSTKPADFLKTLVNPLSSTRTFPTGTKRLPLLINIFLAASFCVMALMISPLLLFRRKELAQGRPTQLIFLLLFFLLGAAFMLVEISMLQQLFVFLGDPTLTFAVTLGVMLAFTGLGSLFSQRFPAARLPGRITGAAAITLAIQAAVYLLLPALIAYAQGAPLAVRLGVAFPALALIAMPMGMLFPSFLRLLGVLKLDIACWSWGMNGVGSVLGSVGASMIALNLGIRFVFVTGMALYVIVFLTTIPLIYLARTRH